VLSFGQDEIPGTGAWLDGDTLRVRWQDVDLSLPRPALLALDGVHGGLNTLAALGACLAYGVPEDAIRDGLASFRGVENRLETIATSQGVTFVNDTSATAPAAAIAALRVLGPRARRLHLIAGGADKQTDLTPFADQVARMNVSVYLLEGTATPALTELLRERDVAISGTFDRMAAAVEQASLAAQDGDYVVLSPACASFGMFRNEFDRGAQFRSAVHNLIAD
jgi:UDP-N-acetylmuramoylalanine--D-glutamate ligase